MRITQRITLALLLALGASGCAGLTFQQGCGLGAADPMTDGVARMSPRAGLHRTIGLQQTYQKKQYFSGGGRFDRSIRRPGQTSPSVSLFCGR